MGTVINQLVNQARQSLCINSFSITLKRSDRASNDPGNSVFCIYKPPLTQLLRAMLGSSSAAWERSRKPALAGLSG